MATQAPNRQRKPRLAAIEYIRGISMMGVIGIHVGSQYLMNPMANLHMVALFEVATRFSVPIFFFISAFGLFYNLDIKEKFDYVSFLKRRWKTVFVPYLVWSLFYLGHDGWLYGVGFPDPLHLLAILFFGNGKYQLYFLVILLWFYLLMPLWLRLMRVMTWPWLAFLLIVQVGFDYWSSFSVPLNTFVYSLPDNSWLKPFFLYRLNYWVFHYVFIFMLGGYLAVHMEGFLEFMKKWRYPVIAAFWLSLAALLGYYYQIINMNGYTPMEAVNTAHQLCPAGIAYTIAASIFFFTIFTYNNYPEFLKQALHILGKHSYFAYLVHPFFIGYMALGLQRSGCILTGGLALCFYAAALALSVAAAACLRSIGERWPFINILTIGVYPKKK